MPVSTNRPSNSFSRGETSSGLRLALIGPIPPPSGGMAMQARQLAERLRQEGLTVEFVATNPPYKLLCIGQVRGLRALFRLVPYVRCLWQVAGRVQLIHVMANSGWSWHLFAAPAVWIGAWRGTPVLVNYRGGAANQFLQRQFRWVAPSLRRASRIVVPSPYLRDVFLRFGIRADIIPNSVDGEVFHPEAGEAGERGREPCLLVARHLEPLYDVATAIRAFALVKHRFPGAELEVAGSGPELEPLRRLATSLKVGASVHFCGNLDRAQMAESYRRADVLLNPSIEDNMPNSLLEAMASGVPIVTTDVGGIPYMVRHEFNGLLVPRSDPEAMSQAALRVLDDGRLRVQLVTAGLAQARRHAWCEVRTSWLSLYRALARH